MINNKDLELFKDKLNGQLIDSNNADYENARKIWNGMIDKQSAESEWPPCIAELAPRFVMVTPDNGGHLRVRLLWGSGFIGSWGIVVGRADMPMPPSDASGSREQRYPLAPGAYVWSSE